MNTTASALVPFDYEGRQVRTYTDDQGEPWFVAADVCSVLAISNVSQALSRLDGDEKTLISNEGGSQAGPQSLNLINEPGLYALVLSSRKAEAKRFKRWVTHEVLPTIRRTGRYAINSEPTANLRFPANQQDTVSALLLIGQAVAQVPGVRPGIAMAATLTCIQENTGLVIETLRRALPAASEPTCSHNATQLGKLAGSSAKVTNQRLAIRGFQFRNERDEWELTDAGKAWAEAMPFSRNGHSGYQILWNPTVVDQLKEVA